MEGNRSTLSKAPLVQPDQSEAKVSKVLAVLAAASSSPSMAAPCTASCRSRAAAVSLLSPSGGQGSGLIQGGFFNSPPPEFG